MKLAACVAAGLSALLLALGYALAGQVAGAAASAALGGLWLWGLARGTPGAGALGLFTMAATSAAGVLLLAPAPLLLLSVTSALAAWNLARFGGRMRAAGQVHNASALERAHLRRLAITLGAGLALGGVALGARVSLGFGWTLALGALAVVALGQVVRRLARGG